MDKIDLAASVQTSEVGVLKGDERLPPEALWKKYK